MACGIAPGLEQLVALRTSDPAARAARSGTTWRVLSRAPSRIPRSENGLRPGDDKKGALAGGAYKTSANDAHAHRRRPRCWTICDEGTKGKSGNGKRTCADGTAIRQQTQVRNAIVAYIQYTAICGFRRCTHPDKHASADRFVLSRIPLNLFPKVSSVATAQGNWRRDAAEMAGDSATAAIGPTDFVIRLTRGGIVESPSRSGFPA